MFSLNKSELNVIKLTLKYTYINKLLKQILKTTYEKQFKSEFPRF